MLERLTADAQLIVANADAHARRLRHRWIGCEHLLLAVCGHGDATADALNGLGATPAAIEAAIRTIANRPPVNIDPDALSTIGIDLETVQRRIEAAFGPGSLSRAGSPRRRLRMHRPRGCAPTDDALPFSPRAKNALELAVHRARADGRLRAYTSDLAAALTDVPGSMAQRVLDLLDVSRDQVHRALGSSRRAG